MFISFDRIHERDRRTYRQTSDVQTPHMTIDRACIALRGKNVLLVIPSRFKSYLSETRNVAFSREMAFSIFLLTLCFMPSMTLTRAERYKDYNETEMYEMMT